MTSHSPPPGPSGSMREPHEHSGAAGAPGASAPGEPGYEGDVTVGEDARQGPSEEYEDPFGRPGDVPDGGEDVPAALREKLDEIDSLVDERHRP